MLPKTGYLCLLYAITAIVVVLSGSRSQAQMLDGNIAGIWSTQPCSEQGQFLLFNAGAVLIFDTREDPVSVIFGPAKTASGMIALSRGGNVSILPDFATMNRCQSLPNTILAPFGEAVALFLGWNDVIRACRERSTKTCVYNAFALFDVSRDRRLSQAEIARLLRGLGFFIGYEMIVEGRNGLGMSNRSSGSSAGLFTVPVDQLYASSVVAALAGATASRGVINSYDYDGDGFLSLDELLQDRGKDTISGILGSVNAGGVQIVLPQLLPLLGEAADLLQP